MWCTVDIVEKLKPKFVIWENVKNLLSKKHIHNFNNYLEIMEKLNYNSYYEVLNAKDFGIPQNRERIYTISIRKDIDMKTFKFPNKQELKLRLKDILEDTVEDKYYLSDKMIQGFREHNKNHQEKGTGFIWNTRDKNGIASTIRANAALCPTDNTINVGEVTPNSQAGQVYSEEGVSPTITAGTHGYSVGNILASNKCVRIGGMFDTEKSKHQAGSIYNKEGLAPSLDSMQGGYRQPLVTIDNPLKGKSNYGWHFEQNVYSEDSQCCRSVKAGGGSGNIPKVITTDNCNKNKPKIIGKTVHLDKDYKMCEKVGDRGTNKYSIKDTAFTISANPMSDRGQMVIECTETNQERNSNNKIIYEEPLKRKGWHRKACEVLNTDGISTCIHTQSNNLLQKIKVEERFFKQAIETCEKNNCDNGDTIDAFNQKVNSTGISPTITTRPEGFKTAILPIQNYRIRKLTPKECWRLMRFYR